MVQYLIPKIGAVKSTPKYYLFIKYHEVFLEYKRQFLSERFMYKIATKNSSFIISLNII